jgi:hypothetical protein
MFSWSNRSLWNAVMGRLSSFAAHHSDLIEDCYIRHSAAYGPQDLLLSDIDITLFVQAADISSLQHANKRLRKTLNSDPLLCWFVRDIIILPASRACYELCQTSYPFRSRYPMDSWARIGSAPKIAPTVIQFSVPLDHLPENFLVYYAADILADKRQPHLFSRQFLRRCVCRDADVTAYSGEIPDVFTFWDALSAQFSVWHSFYNSPLRSNGSAVFECSFGGCEENSACRAVVDRWHGNTKTISDLSEVVSSLWVHPCSFWESAPIVTVNFAVGVSSSDCRRCLQAVTSILSGTSYQLRLGSEQAMVGRISGLSRLGILDPWLFCQDGVCLYGDSDLRERIILPSREQLHQKFKELLLFYIYDYLAYGRFCQSFLTLSLIVHQLLKNNILMLDKVKLASLYPKIGSTLGEKNQAMGNKWIFNTLESHHKFSPFESTRRKFPSVERLPTSDSKKPLVSVIVPSFNYAWCISETIDSILRQDYPSWEMIVVDDGSTDDSWSLLSGVQRAHPDRIKLYRHPDQKNHGLLATYRLALEKCSGQFIAFLEADDMWEADCLSARMAVFAEHPGVVVVANSVAPFGEELVLNRLLPVVEFTNNSIKTRHVPYYAFRELANWNPYLSFSAFMAKAAALHRVDWSGQGFPEALWLDWWVLVQLSLEGQFYFIPEKKTRWRLHSRSANSQYSSPVNAVKREQRAHLAQQVVRQKLIRSSVSLELLEKKERDCVVHG